jgi:excinuclease ABC subunit A
MCLNWICIDMGPEGGDEGGNVVFEGTPEDLIKNGLALLGCLKKVQH